MDFNKLWQNFMDTVTNHYMDFAGRVGRAQFWYFILVCVVVAIAAAILDAILATIIGRALIGVVIGLILLLPIGGMAARRLQDSGNNGQLVWIWVAADGVSQALRLLHAMFPPVVAIDFSSTGVTYSSGFGGYGILDTLAGLVLLVASVALIYFCVQPGTSGENQYGPEPPAWTPNAG